MTTAGFFSLIADETTDISSIEQLSVLLRYVHLAGQQVTTKELFIMMTDVDDLTGAGLKQKLQTIIVDLGLNYNNLVGLGFDGAANMSGHLSGAQALFRNDLPHAFYVHCFAHKLSLVLVSSTKFPPIQNCNSVIAGCIDFLSSPKRKRLLEQLMTSGPFENMTSSKLITLCQTRWVEKHDAVERFCELFEPVRFTLEHMAVSAEFEPDVRRNAMALLKSTKAPLFCYSLVLLRKVLSLTYTLSVQLQAVELDLVGAYTLVSDVLATLETWGLREKTEIYNHTCNLIPMRIRPEAAQWRSRSQPAEPESNSDEEQYSIHGFDDDGEAV